MSGPDSSPSRRDFLKIAAGTGLLAVTLPTVKRLEGQFTTTPELKKVGLEEFSGVFKEASKIKNLFGNNAWFFSDICYTLDKAAKGELNINSPEAISLRDGWATAYPENFREQAFEHLSKISIDVSETTDGTTEFGVRKFLGGILQAFPVLLLAFPNKLKVVSTGYGYANNDSLQLVTNDRIRLALHEPVHETDTYRRTETKAFMKRDIFAAYVERFLGTSYDLILNEWILKSQDTILHFYHGKPLIGIWERPDNVTQDDLDSLSEQMFSIQENLNLVHPVKLKKGLSEEAVIANWNILLHQMSRELFKMSDSERATFLQRHQDQAIKLFFNGISSTSQTGAGATPALDGLVTRFEHEMVDPVFSDEQGKELKHPLIKAKLAVQETRLSLVSILPSHSGYMGLREALGLTPIV